MQATIARHTAHMREQSRVVSRQRAGQAVIESVEVDPSVVAPNGTVNVTVNLRETAEFVGPGPELCAPGGVFGSGLAVLVTVSGDWGDQDDTEVCIPVLTTGAGRVNPTFTLTAPSLPQNIREQSRSITTEIQIRGKPARTAMTSEALTVRSGARREPREDGNGDGADQPFRPGLCLIEPQRSCNTPEVLAMALFLIVVVAAAT